jgi:hypothetical protein
MIAQTASTIAVPSSAKRAAVPLVDPDMLPVQMKAGKSHKIVAQETAHPRPPDQARSVDGWHFSVIQYDFFRM